LVTAHRFIYDSRDEGAAERMHVITETSGLARCHTIYNCTTVWPREMYITKAIGEQNMYSLMGRID
jgi:succinate dehydrogenase / fumarate reductase iron-sulfur subunit